MILVVFDIDDTISQTALLHQKLFTEFIKSLGIHDFDDNFSGYLHHSDHYIANEIYKRHFGLSMSSIQISEMESFLLEELTKNPIHEIKGAVQFIRELKSKGIAYCFATGALAKTGAYKLRQLGIEFNEELLVGSNTIPEREGIVSQAIKGALRFYKQTEFTRIWSLGDGLWDLKTANKLGLAFIGIGERNKRILSKYGASILHEDYSNLNAEILM